MGGERKLRILISASGYFPAQNYGGPPVSIRNFCKLIEDDFECYIITRDHEYNRKGRLEGIGYGWQSISNYKVLYLSKNEHTLSKYKKILDEVSPDWIYINSFFDARFTLPLLICGRQFHVPCLIAPRGEFAPQALSRKKLKKKPYILLFQKLFTNSLVWYHAASSIEKKDILRNIKHEENHVVVLPNVPSAPRQIEVKKGKQQGKLHIIYLARITPVKNLSYALDVIRNLRGDITLNIYGPIESKKYWEECKSKINNLPQNIKTNYRGELQHKEIYKVLRENELLFLPSLMESYSQSIAEALYAGLPVITSDCTPWRELEVRKCGYSGSLEDTHEFIEWMQKFVDMSDEVFQVWSNNAIEYVIAKSDASRTKRMYLSFFNMFGNDL